MKKIWICMMLMLLLTGCGAQETFETVNDWYYEPVVSAGIISLALPEEAAAAAMTSENGSIYLCDGYSICLQTLDGGDLSETLRSVSGFDREQLALIQTQQQGMARYDFVWASAGEGGDQVGRAAVLDDGHHHYVLSVMADAARSADYEDRWQALFASFSLGTAP